MSALRVILIVVCTIAGLGILLFVGCAGCLASLVKIGADNHNASTESYSTASDSSSSSIPPTPAIRTTANQLFADYHANEVAADQRYKGQHLLVSGVVQSIDKDFLDHIVLRLSTANEFESVMAQLSKQDENKAAALVIGSPVLVNCTGGTMVVGSPNLDDCVLVEQKPIPDSPAQQSPPQEMSQAPSASTPESTVSPAVQQPSSATAAQPQAVASQSQQSQAEGLTPEDFEKSAKALVGYSEDNIRAALGPPLSTSFSGDRKLMHYPHGIVTLKDGVVIAVERY